MSCAYVSRILLCAASLFIIPIQAHAGGYSGGQGQFSAITPRQAHTILSYADSYRDGNFRVEHTESASATANIGPGGETGTGSAYSHTSVENSAGFRFWKRSVQRTNGHAANGSANGSGFSTSFVKIRTNDGKYYIFKGIANTTASADGSGTASQKWGLAKSAGGRY